MAPISASSPTPPSTPCTSKRLGELDPARAAAIGNQIDQQLWTQLPLIPLYQIPSFLAWRQDLLNVADNPTTETLFWNAGSWGYAKP